MIRLIRRLRCLYYRLRYGKDLVGYYRGIPIIKTDFLDNEEEQK